MVHVETPYLDTPRDPVDMYRMIKYLDGKYLKAGVTKSKYFIDGEWDVDGMRSTIEALKKWLTRRILKDLEGS